MVKQSLSIIEFPQLYNILDEIKNLFKFNIHYYESSKDFLDKTNPNDIKNINSTIIINKKNSELFSNNKIIKTNILILDDLPIKIEKLIDKINTQIIKQKYSSQSKLNIKNYNLDINSRVLSNSSNKLKLTEKEIDIILFLNEKKKPQTVNDLQNQVWGYSFGLETHTVETHIYRLRKKVKEKFFDEKFIISNDRGYEI